MGTFKTRQDKINYLKNLIDKFFSSKKDKRISKTKLIAEFIVSQNSTSRTADELLKALAATNYIKINGDEITNG
jgi:hypothetical protein